MSKAKPLLRLEYPIVGGLHASQDSQQRGLSRPVATYQANPLLGFQRKAGVVQQCHMAKSQLRVGEGDQSHTETIIRVPIYRGSKGLSGRTFCLAMDEVFCLTGWASPEPDVSSEREAADVDRERQRVCPRIGVEPTTQPDGVDDANRISGGRVPKMAHR